jgi:hypothetical protein
MSRFAPHCPRFQGLLVLVLLLLLPLLPTVPTVVVPPLLLFSTPTSYSQLIDVMEQCLQIVWCNQEISHSQQDEPLLEFPNVPVYPPPVPDPYASLIPAELAAFGIGPARVDNDDDDDEEEVRDDEEIEDDE